MSNRHFLRLVLIINFVLILPKLYAEQNAADIEAISLIGKQVTQWWNNLPKDKPSAISILSTNVSSNLDTNFGIISEDILLAALARASNTKAVSCFECRTPRVIVKNERLIVTKGIPNSETFRNLARELELDAFLTVFVSKTPLFLKVLITAHKAPSGEIFASKEFSVSNVSLSDTSMQFRFVSGMLWDIPLRQKRDPDSLPVIIDFSWIQSLGPYSRVGMSLGTFLLGQTGNLGYLRPSLGWNLQFGQSSIFLYPSISAGFGIKMPTMLEEVIKKEFSFGLSTSVSLDLYLGHFVFFGPTLDFYLPFVARQIDQMILYPGFHLGIALGR